MRHLAPSGSMMMKVDTCGKINYSPHRATFRHIQQQNVILRFGEIWFKVAQFD